MKPGLVSITFRKLTPAQILELCTASGLTSIEWGGDVHAPHGDVQTAEAVRQASEEAGVEIIAYGSYFRLAGDVPGPSFGDVLASAKALGTRAIRVWAGTRGSEAADEAYFKAVRDEALRCADLAGAEGITLCYECHGGTITDTLSSSMKLLEATEHPYIRTLWQPFFDRSLEENLESLRAHIPKLHHVHVFHWIPDPLRRRPLAEGADAWGAYVGELRSAGWSSGLLLEFVADDLPEALPADAETLRRIIA